MPAATALFTPAAASPLAATSDNALITEYRDFLRKTPFFLAFARSESDPEESEAVLWELARVGTMITLSPNEGVAVPPDQRALKSSSCRGWVKKSQSEEACLWFVVCCTGQLELLADKSTSQQRGLLSRVFTTASTSASGRPSSNAAPTPGTRRPGDMMLLRAGLRHPLNAAVESRVLFLPQRALQGILRQRQRQRSLVVAEVDLPRRVLSGGGVGEKSTPDDGVCHSVQDLLMRSVGGIDFKQVLRQVPYFSDVKDSVLSRIGTLFSFQGFGAGQTIYSRGQVGDTFFILLAGAVAIYDAREQVIMQRKAVSFFGATALIRDGATRQFTARSVDSAVAVLSLHRNDFLLFRHSFQARKASSVRRDACYGVGPLPHFFGARHAPCCAPQSLSWSRPASIGPLYHAPITAEAQLVLQCRLRSVLSHVHRASPSASSTAFSTRRVAACCTRH